ncbi:MAG: 16S rRNA (guanine(527)-N(7))-methyltransferase RsmG [Devosia sp.]
MTQQSDLEAYAALLLKWNGAQNLVSRETIDQLWPRHITDSLQLMPLIGAGARSIVDVGSGGGFPAIPMAIASRGDGRRFTLLEPNARKAAFLRTVARELSLPVSVESVRAEDRDSRETFDLVTARAVAALPALLGLVARFCAPESQILLPKGRNYRQELAAAAALFDFDVLVHASKSEPEAVILEINKLRAKSAA